MSGASSALNALIEEATKLLNAESLSTTETRDALNKAIEDATAAAAGDMTPEVYAAQTEALNAAMEAEREAVTAAADLEAKAEDHDEKLQYTGAYPEYGYLENYGDTEGFEELEILVFEILDTKIAEAGAFASMQEIEDYSARLDVAYTKMTSGLYDYSTASKDAALDVTGLINTPSFQKKGFNTNDELVDVAACDGWVGASLNGSDASKVTGAFNYEMFGSDACAEDASVAQTLHNAPAGYYRLVVNGFYRAGGYVDAALARRDSAESQFAELFVESGAENKWSKALPSIFEDVREFTKYDGDVMLADTLLPDMADMAYRIIVNGVTGANSAFEAGSYELSLSFRVAEGEEPVIGIRKTGKITNDWTCFDNFRLYYLGDGDANRPDDFTDDVEDVIGEGTAEVVGTTWATLNGMKIAEPKQGGIYIRIDKMSDGTTKATKVLVK